MCRIKFLDNYTACWLLIAFVLVSNFHENIKVCKQCKLSKIILFWNRSPFSLVDLCYPVGAIEWLKLDLWKLKMDTFSVSKEAKKSINAVHFKCATHKVAVTYIQLLEQTVPSWTHTDEFPNVVGFDIPRMIHSTVVRFHHYRGLSNTATW